MAKTNQPPQRLSNSPIRFRWSTVAWPLVILIVYWLFTSATTSVTWNDLLKSWAVVDRPRFSAACTLAAVCSASIAAVRISSRK